MIPCCWYAAVTGLSNLASTSKSVFPTGWSRRTTESTPVQTSWATPAGTPSRSWVPLIDSVPSPTGSTSVQMPVFRLPELNSSERTEAEHAAVVNVASDVTPSLPAASSARIWKW